ncbi:MAG: M50 family metallopeptidase, partial [Anaerolineae bacterium]|nr:M50 family metallopeptidase [Anaerolineae bacterium]
MGFELTTADRRLLILIAALVLVFILWNIPQLDFVLYPFRLFVTYVHEAGHGTAALLTGGRFLGFEIFANGAGQAITAGGSRLLILPAGYLGAALFGAILFYLNNRFHYSRALSVVL